MDKSFGKKGMKGLEVRFEAQKIAFAPIVFQCVRLLWKKGILKQLSDAGNEGLTVKEISAATGVSEYGATILLETGLSADVVEIKDDRYVVTRVGDFVLNDEMTRVNMDFNHHFNYQGMFHLEEAIDKGEPAGLQVFGEWPTVYEALAHLPNDAKDAWFGFDHYYSDSAFNQVLPMVFKNKPARLMDIGGNTGRWALRCLEYDEDVQITIVDLPGQLAKAHANIKQAGHDSRFKGVAVNLLDRESALPTGCQVIWMSQFLCCFSEDEIVSILARVREAMDDDTSLFILDTYWDRQQYDIASYCLINTSPYFTAMANGNSRMYQSRTMLDCIAGAGLRVESDTDNLGLSHTLFVCRKG